MPAFLEDVLPWLAAFFILDALVNLRRGQVMIARAMRGPFGLLRSGLHLAGASPLGASITAYELPFLATREGLWSFDADARASPPVVEPWALAFIPWTSLGDLRGEGTAVKGAGRVLFRARTAADAQALAADLVRLRDLPEAQREDERQRRLEAGFDVDAVRTRWSRLRRPAAIAAAFGTLEALVLFVALPALVFGTSGTGLHWQLAFSALAVGHVGALIAAGWALRRSGADAQLRASTLLTLGIFPSYAARAGIHVVRDAFSAFEPLALAAVLLPREDFLRLARRELVRTSESLEATRELGLADLWTARRRSIEALLGTAGTPVAEVLALPASMVGVDAWCPLCLGEYRQGFQRCSDCCVSLEHREPGAAARAPGVEAVGPG